MARYLMFGSSFHTPNGGWNDHLKSSDSLQELIDSVNPNVYDIDAKIARAEQDRWWKKKDKEKFIASWELHRGQIENFSIGDEICEWVEIIDLETEQPVWNASDLK